MAASPPQQPDAGSWFPAAVHDLLRRSGKALEIALTAGDAKVGQTPKDIVWSHGRTRLYHYRPLAERTAGSPLLLVHSLISKPYILDLYPGGSFVEFMLGRGFDVYLLDWGAPTEDDRGLRLEDYALALLPEAVRRVARGSPTRRVLLLGYCMGGMLVALYSALHPRAPLDAIACLTTPVDFHQMGLFSVWSDRRYFDVDALVDRVGNVPAEFLRESFAMLKPASRYSPALYLSLWQNIFDDRYVEQYKALNKWTNDHIPFPGECFRQTVKELFWDNKLMAGDLTLAGTRVDLGRIRRPFLHVMAARDHIVPRASAEPLIELVGSRDKEQIVLDGGHVGLVAGRGAVRGLWPRVVDWLAAHSMVPAEGDARDSPPVRPPRVMPAPPGRVRPVDGG